MPENWGQRFPQKRRSQSTERDGQGNGGVGLRGPQKAAGEGTRRHMGERLERGKAVALGRQQWPFAIQGHGGSAQNWEWGGG